MTRKHRYIDTEWECWTYDVWGNPRDGYEVNDRSCFARKASLRLRVETANPGTGNAFDHAAPTIAQIKALFGLSCQLETDGDDRAVYITRRRDGRPLGEMFCHSHTSLSPIRKATGGEKPFQGWSDG